MQLTLTDAKELFMLVKLLRLERERLTKKLEKSKDGSNSRINLADELETIDALLVSLKKLNPIIGD